MEPSEIERWAAVGRDLETSPRVHRPSTFSALLAATMADTQGLVVVDAGCGAGLVALAALAAGARHVVAQDYDRAALEDTARNVSRILGAEARSRMTLWECDWTQLGPMNADVLAANPPQRPTELLPDVPPEERHLHDGGGADGLDAVRLILAHAGAARVRTTAAAILRLNESTFPGWSTPRSIANMELHYDPAWRTLIPDLMGHVDVWELEKRSA